MLQSADNGGMDALLALADINLIDNKGDRRRGVLPTEGPASIDTPLLLPCVLFSDFSLPHILAGSFFLVFFLNNLFSFFSVHYYVNS